MTKQDWNQFIIKNNNSFLQSWQWGEFQKSVGRKIWRVERAGVKALVIRQGLPFGKNYLYCPRGPIGSLNEFLKEVKPIAKREKSIFLKIEPDAGFSQNLANFKKSLKEIQPSKTIILDILRPAEEILFHLRPKTRYNIRLAEKKGVRIEEKNNNESLEEFLKLAKMTAKRDRFSLHPKGYYKKMMEVLGEEGIARLYLAKSKNRVIAADLVVFFGQTATYLHGASDYHYRQLMAPYLLKWQEINQAKKLGLKYFDLYGINETKWPGVTRFKKGFLPDGGQGGGKEVVFPGACDLVFNPLWYQAYNLARRIF